MPRNQAKKYFKDKPFNREDFKDKKTTKGFEGKCTECEQKALITRDWSNPKFTKKKYWTGTYCLYHAAKTAGML